MEEKDGFGGFSLRKKRSVRPKISAPRAQISAPIATSLPPAAQRPSLAPIDQSYRKGSDSGQNTADYVKRRYSTRVHQLPQEAYDAPAIPAIPSQFTNGGSQAPAAAQSLGSENGNIRRHSMPREKIAVDLSALQTSDLRTEQCMLGRYL